MSVDLPYSPVERGQVVSEEVVIQVLLDRPRLAVGGVPVEVVLC